jgi:glycosyltransferase involved in cell wall biosynthesis
MPEKKRMKIAFVYDVIYPYVKGGVEKRVWELSVRLAGRGHEVHVFGMKYWDGFDILVRDGVILHGVCPAKPLYFQGKRTVGEAINFSIRLIPALAHGRFDIIDCQQFPYFSCLFAKGVSIMKKTPLVITWHEVWGNYWYAYLGATGSAGKYIEKLVSRITPHSVAVSRTTAEQLEPLRGSRPTAVIPNGVDLKRIAATAPAQEPTDVLFAGRLIREKHADFLIEAFALLVRENPDLRLLIIGEGPEAENLNDLIRKKDLMHAAQIRGFYPTHDELIAQMKSSGVFVLPSTREGFGISALEALACGVPVVTVRHPANAVRDLVTHKTGFLCTLTPEDIARGIREALRHREEMQEDCITAAQGYDWDRIAEETETWYSSII